MRNRGIIERYRPYLPVTPSTRIISLNEGSTPLIPASKLSEAIHPRIELWLKYEGLNPTGSFKDRGMTMAITKAVEDGFFVGAGDFTVGRDIVIAAGRQAAHGSVSGAVVIAALPVGIGGDGITSDNVEGQGLR